MIPEPTPALPLNRNAIISAIAAFLTLVSVCIAVAPIPFTGYVCYPAGALLGLVALVTGVVSLIQTRTRRENGRAYAWIGVWVGGLALIGSVCAIGIGIALFPRVIAFVHQYVK